MLVVTSVPMEVLGVCVLGIISILKIVMRIWMVSVIVVHLFHPFFIYLFVCVCKREKPDSQTNESRAKGKMLNEVNNLSGK